MRAIVIDKHGGPEVLGLAERPDPEAAPGQVILLNGASSSGKTSIVARGPAPRAFTRLRDRGYVGDSW